MTIHNLQRVEAGLRGEWLAPILDLEESGVKFASGSMDAGMITGEGDQMQLDGWQDLDEYRREQSIEEGVTSGDKILRPDETVATQTDEWDVTSTRGKSEDRKTKTRKLEKKARRKQEQKEKQEKIRKAAGH